MGALILLVLLGVGSLVPAQAADIVSYAIVNSDGTLKVSNKIVRLYGVYIPARDYTCREFIRPIECGSRSVLALKFKVGSRFVHCNTQATFDDGSIGAYCSIDGDDLGAYMLENGWAAALPYAPFEYELLERIARTHEVGIWGIPVDRIIR